MPVKWLHCAPGSMYRATRNGPTFGAGCLPWLGQHHAEPRTTSSKLEGPGPRWRLDSEGCEMLMWIGRIYSFFVKSLEKCEGCEYNAYLKMSWGSLRWISFAKRTGEIRWPKHQPCLTRSKYMQVYVFIWSSVCWSLVDTSWVHYSQVPSSCMSWTCSKSEPPRRRWLLLPRAVCPKWPNFWRVKSDGPLTWARCLGCGSSADKLFDQDFNEHFRFLVLRCSETSERMRGLQLYTIESSWISWNMLANSINPIHPKLHLRLFPMLAKSCWYWPIAWRIRDKASQINCGRWMPCTPSHPRQEMLGRSGEKMWKQGR